MSIDALSDFYTELVATLRGMVGAHRVWKPFYPNFPQQVMEMDEGRLYINTIIHYLTNLRPVFPKQERPPLQDETPLKVIDLGTPEDFEAIFTRLAASKTSLSGEDAEDVGWFVQHYGNGIYRLLPAAVPLKENVALLGARLIQHTGAAESFLREQVKTAMDMLRLAVALSDGDVSQRALESVIDAAWKKLTALYERKRCLMR